MLTRIRNALIARQDQTTMPASQMKLAVAKILKEEGFIKDYELVKDQKFRTMRIWMRYTGKKVPVLTGVKRVSKPGLRVYVKATEMPRVFGGLGIAIVTTPKGVMTADSARHENVGGEVLCHVW
jgi:small subunit ribosomal protein S8